MFNIWDKSAYENNKQTNQNGLEFRQILIGNQNTCLGIDLDLGYRHIFQIKNQFDQQQKRPNSN